jgi:hypothetical protein
MDRRATRAVELARKHPELLRQFADGLGVTVDSLERLNVGMI